MLEAWKLSDSRAVTPHSSSSRATPRSTVARYRFVAVLEDQLLPVGGQGQDVVPLHPLPDSRGPRERPIGIDRQLPVRKQV